VPRGEMSVGRVCGVAELPLPPARHCEPAHLIPRPMYRRDLVRLGQRHRLTELIQAVPSGKADLH
jgi:hypothetical protein